MGRGSSIYTVEEVSERLGIPRPTLYRYLRDYGISHARQSGRIAIPEDSFDTIREARDLHREGLGTESVRKRLAEDEAGLAERLDGISDALEDLRENLGSPHGMTTQEALRIILARQTLLISAVSELSGMVEDLLATETGARRRRHILEPSTLDERATVAPGLPAAAGYEVAPRPTAPPLEERAVVEHRSRFGTRRRRRRWGVLGGIVATVLLLGAAALASPSAVPDALANLGLRAGMTAAPGSAAPDERREDSPEVVRQTEGGDQDAPARAGTTNTRADRPATTAVPDVSGEDLREAARRLRQDGFRVPGFVVGPGAQGEVLGTRPAAGERMERGAPVVLVLGDGSSPGG